MRSKTGKLIPKNCQFPRKSSICIAISFLNLMGVMCFMVYSPEVLKSSYHYHTEKWTSRFTFNTCHLPELDPFSDEVMPFVKPSLPFRCHHTANSIGIKIFEMPKGTRTLKKISAEYDNCCYRPFFRENDQSERAMSNCFKIQNLTTEIPPEYDFIEVICTGTQDYADGFAIISIDKSNSKSLNIDGLDLTRLKQHKKLNVIVLGIDATSRMNFLRKMPKTRSYLLKNLSAVEMKGYTKVAENTLPNVVPLLTGLTLEEMKLKCAFKSGLHVQIDSCPFIWHNYSADGYKTSYAEDDIDIGIFNMNWKYAFKNPPTDFYFRPFAQRMQRRQSSAFHQCLGTRLSLQTLLDNIENLAVAMHNYSSYFQFTWATRLSHDDMNRLSIADDPLLEFLEFLNDNGYLNNTALLIMSDHGSRLDKGIRSTEQGKLEDRLPMFYIAMPSWFKDEYPVAWENLNSNSERLTSAFDLHETFRDLIHLDKLRARKSTKISEKPSSRNSSSSLRKPSSLFQPLSPNRTCADAGIPMHWCTCFNKTPLNLDSDDAKEGATFVISYINSMLLLQWKCATLSLSKVIEIFEVHREEFLLKESNLASTKKHTVRLLHIAFETKPGGANFEATIIKVNGEWGITENPARINAYEGQSGCVEQEYKPFCYCKP